MIKVKNKKEIIKQFSFFDEKVGMYRLQLRLEGSLTKCLVESVSGEELASAFNALLKHMLINAKREIQEKMIQFGKNKMIEDFLGEIQIEGGGNSTDTTKNKEE